MKKNFWHFFNRLQDVLNSADPHSIVVGQRALSELEKGNAGEALRLLDLDVKDFYLVFALSMA